MKRSYTLILGLVATGMLVWLVTYLSTGMVTVTTNNKSDSITLQRTSQGKPFIKTGLGSLSAAVGHGQYTATVKNGARTIVQTINFTSGHKTFRYALSPADIQAVEPVSNQHASDITVADQLVYRGADSDYLYSIDARNNLARSSSSQQLQAVKWASSSFGVGQDSGGHLYAVGHGSVNRLRVPFAYNGAAVSFDVSTNKDIYISYGADVYRGGFSGNFTKIYTAPSSKLLLAAGAGQVAVTVDAETQSAPKPWVAIVGASGKITKKTAAGQIRRLTWSPSGHYLASINESYATVYDPSLRQVATIPTNSLAGYVEGFVGYLAWRNDNNLLYTSNTGVWSYDLANQKAALLATAPPNNFIAELAISSDKSYAYITTVGPRPNPDYAIKRVGLNGQHAAPLLQQIGGLFPMRLNDCSVGLVNFGQPTAILITPFPDSSLTPQAYIQEAQNGLSQVGIDPSKFQYELADVTGE